MDLIELLRLFCEVYTIGSEDDDEFYNQLLLNDESFFEEISGLDKISFSSDNEEARKTRYCQVKNDLNLFKDIYSNGIILGSSQYKDANEYYGYKNIISDLHLLSKIPNDLINGGESFIFTKKHNKHYVSTTFEINEAGIRRVDELISMKNMTTIDFRKKDRIFSVRKYETQNEDSEHMNMISVSLVGRAFNTRESYFIFHKFDLEYYSGDLESKTYRLGSFLLKAQDGIKKGEYGYLYSVYYDHGYIVSYHTSKSISVFEKFSKDTEMHNYKELLETLKATLVRAIHIDIADDHIEILENDYDFQDYADYELNEIYMDEHFDVGVIDFAYSEGEVYCCEDDSFHSAEDAWMYDGSRY